MIRARFFALFSNGTLREFVSNKQKMKTRVLQIDGQFARKKKRFQINKIVLPVEAARIEEEEDRGEEEKEEEEEEEAAEELLDADYDYK